MIVKMIQAENGLKVTTLRIWNCGNNIKFVRLTTKETILRKSEENSRCWRFLADRIIIFDYAKEADRITIC